MLFEMMKVHNYASDIMALLFAALAVASSNVHAMQIPQPCYVGSKFITTNAYRRSISTSSQPSMLPNYTIRRRGNSASFRPSVLHSQNESIIVDKLKDIEEHIEAKKEFFVADAQFVHLGPAARILTEEFYSSRTNFITFQIEKLKTTLSLESTFPNKDNSLRKEYSRRPLQQMIVACNSKNGEVVGFAEVDARPLGNAQNGVIPDSADGKSNNILRSYMYNLAVDKRWKRKGIASELVKACEGFVSDMHGNCIEKRLYLRVRNSNDAAVALYQKLGYEKMDPALIELSQQDINSGSLEEGELILFAKDFVDQECVLE